MILPDKFVPVQDTYIGLGAYVLKELGDSQKSVSSLWTSLRKIQEIATYERFILTLDFLYAIRAIRLAGNLIERNAK